jgi:UDP-N-acetylglucosamine 4,6-dehydratase
MFKNKNILITGGTGSFGNAFTELLQKKNRPKKIVIYSRDEYKQYLMQNKFPASKFPNMRFLIGDVRDKDRLNQALNEIDYVVHAAALKQVPTAEYNPMEFFKTNVQGAENIVYGSINQKVKKVIALSTDKAANPINLYGATKLASDKIFTAANNITGKQNTIFSVVRYGNVLGSRGSVVPLFKDYIKKKYKYLPITHLQMTRFWITLKQGAEFVLQSFRRMQGGETFVPIIPSIKIVDLAKAMAPKLKLKVIGIRPGEKLHELMCPNETYNLTFKFKDHYLILPFGKENKIKNNMFKNATGAKGKRVSSDFEYASDKNFKFLTIKEIEKYNNHFYGE